LESFEFTCKTEVAVGDAQFRSSVMSDLNLPKFADCKRQHFFDFLEVLDSYVQLEDIPAEMKYQLQ